MPRDLRRDLGGVALGFAGGAVAALVSPVSSGPGLVDELAFMAIAIPIAVAGYCLPGLIRRAVARGEA